MARFGWLLALLLTGSLALAAEETPPVALERIFFLIHPNAYAMMSPAEKEKYALHMEREKQVEVRWKEAMANAGKTSFFVICSPLATNPATPVGEFVRFAAEKLGDRSLVLTGDSSEWVAVLQKTLKVRGLAFDPQTVKCEGWGEAFDGCVAGYSAFLTSVLRLAEPVEVVFDMTVPDMPLLPTARLVKRIRVPGKNIRLFLLEDAQRRPIGLFMPEVAGLTKPVTIALNATAAKLSVYNKQGMLVAPSAAADSLVRPIDGGIQIVLRCDLPSSFYGGKREGPLFFVGNGLSVDELRKILGSADIQEIDAAAAK